MATFREANQVRVSLKMKLSQYAWYSSSTVVSEQDGYAVVVHVKNVDNKVRKAVPPVVDSVSIRVELE